MKCRINLLRRFVFIALVLSMGITFDRTGLLLKSPRAANTANNSLFTASSPANFHKDSAKEGSLLESYGKLPLQFEANRGQYDKRVRFSARHRGYGLQLTATEAVFQLHDVESQATAQKPETQSMPDAPPNLLNRPTSKSSRSAIVRMKMAGANLTPSSEGLEPLSGKLNYLIGNDPKQWHTNVPTFARVAYRNVYPGVDLVWYADKGRLKYDFIVAPGADPAAIKLDFAGAQKLEITAQGDLVVSAAGRELQQQKPVIWQDQDGKRKEIAGRFIRIGKLRIGFEVPDYDSSKPLVIDPVLIYSTYLGGSGSDSAAGVAVDSLGNAYITGSTDSTNFPTTAGSLSPSLPVGGGGHSNAFVTKIDPTGTSIVYSTYIGGNSSTQANAIAVDKDGNAHITGLTSGSFPTTDGAFQKSGGASGNTFVTKLNANGNGLVYSSFIGGSDGGSIGSGIAVDANGGIYLTGRAGKSFPTTANAFQRTCVCGHVSNGDTDAFVARFDPSKSGIDSLTYSSYLGGDQDVFGGTDAGTGISIDSLGFAYIVGYTNSANFPITQGAFQTKLGVGTCPSTGNTRCSDAFVAKLNPSATTGAASLVYSTYLGNMTGPSGGSNHLYDSGNAIAVDASGSAYVTGTTDSPSFPVTAGAFNESIGTTFITKLNQTGTGLVYSARINAGVGTGIALDVAGNAYIVGYKDGPLTVTPDAFQQNLLYYNAYLIKLNATGSGLIYSTQFGGGGNNQLDIAAGIAVDSIGDAYLVGYTDTIGFPTRFPIQPASGGATDAFVAKFGFGVQSQLTVSGILPNKGGNAGQVTATIIGGGFLPGTKATLKCPGQLNITGELVDTDLQERALTVAFDLTGIATNSCDVVVTKVDGDSVTISRGFKIEEGGRPQLAVEISGVNTIRVGRETTFTVALRNDGLIDTSYVLVNLMLDNNNLNVPPYVVANHQPEGSSVFRPIPVGPIGPGMTFTQSVSWTPSISQGCGYIKAEVKDLTEEDIKNQDCEGLRSAIEGLFEIYVDINTRMKMLGCDPDAALEAQPNQCRQLLRRKRNIQFDIRALCKEFNDRPCPGNAPGGCSSLSGLLGTGEQLFRLRQQSLPPVADFHFCTAMSWDPNEKIGTEGIATVRYVRGGAPLSYVISFENLSSASAPAAEVIIKDQLDPNLNWETLSLTGIRIGKKLFQMPTASQNFIHYIDLRPEKNVIGRVIADLDQKSGLLTLRVITIDPATGYPPADPLIGFLPPNKTPPEGEGSIFYVIAPKQGGLTGAKIKNNATIIFDANPSINTLEWVNTLDNTKPVSSILMLNSTQTTPSFTVKWTGTDEGAGVQDYTVFVSENGGPFTIWLANIAATQAVFNGQDGKRYDFYSVARDLVGNVESAKSATEATTRVMICNTATITAAAAIVRQQGGAGNTVTIATVSDPLTTVTATAVPSGVSISNIANNNGTITANVTAACNAAVGASNITLMVANGCGTAQTANLTVNVMANSPPVLGAYPAANAINIGAGTTVTPNAAPIDNGSIASLTATTSNFAGSLNINPANGAVTISNARPAGSYTVSVKATDNCGAVTTTTFPLTVNKLSAAITLNVSSAPYISGQPVKFTAAVAATGGNPTGTVTFKEATTTLGSASLNGSNQAELTTTALSPGMRTITAVYNGDDSFGIASSAALTLNVASVAANVSAANYRGVELAAEEIVAAFGVNLATQTQVASSLPLPTVLAGTSVKVRDSAGMERNAPLFFVSSGQINYLLPPGTANGSAVVTIISGDGSLSIGTVRVDTISPGLFSANSSGEGVAAAVALRVKADGSQTFERVARFDSTQNKFVPLPIDLGPESDQVFLLLYGTGWRNRSSLSAVTTKIGAQSVETSYAGLQGDYVGLDQINALLPRSLMGRGEVDVVVTIDGVTANTVRVSIK